MRKSLDFLTHLCPGADCEKNNTKNLKKTIDKHFPIVYNLLVS